MLPPFCIISRSLGLFFFFPSSWNRLMEGFFSVWFDDIILQFHFDRKDLNGKKKKNMVGLTSGNSLHWSVFFPWNERSVVRREYCVTEICRDVRSRISGRQSSTHATHSPVDRKLEWCGFKRRAKRTFKTAGKSRAWWSYLAFILYSV